MAEITASIFEYDGIILFGGVCAEISIN